MTPPPNVVLRPRAIHPRLISETSGSRPAPPPQRLRPHKGSLPTPPHEKPRPSGALGPGLPPAGPRPPPAPGLSKMEGASRAPLALRLFVFAALPATGWLTTRTLEPPLLPPAPKVGLGGRDSAGILGEKPGPGTWTAASASTPPTSQRAGRGLGAGLPKGGEWWGEAPKETGAAGDGGGERVKGNL